MPRTQEPGGRLHGGSQPLSRGALGSLQPLCPGGSGCFQAVCLFSNPPWSWLRTFLPPGALPGAGMPTACPGRAQGWGCTPGAAHARTPRPEESHVNSLAPKVLPSTGHRGRRGDTRYHAHWRLAPAPLPHAGREMRRGCRTAAGHAGHTDQGAPSLDPTPSPRARDTPGGRCGAGPHASQPPPHAAGSRSTLSPLGPGDLPGLPRGPRRPLHPS